MDYNTFKSTLDQKKIHFLDNDQVLTEGYTLEEPLYAIRSSGTYSDQIFLHSLSGIKKSCDSFFKTFNIDEGDRWGVCLPSYHVASFSVLCRSYFGNLKAPKKYSWNLNELISILSEVSLLSLVPTQIYEIVSKGLKCSNSIKYVFVGGSSLDFNLYTRAKDLGWPIIPCYGSTETFAQMSFSKNGKTYAPFKGWRVNLDKEKNNLVISGEALYLGKIHNGKIIKRESDQLVTNDIAKINSSGEFQIIGRSSEKIKIKGEFFDFNKFKKDFCDNYDFNKLYPIIIEEKRNGAGLYLLAQYQHEEITKKALQKFKKIRGVFFVKEVPKTAIGKISQLQLKDELQVPVLYV